MNRWSLKYLAIVLFLSASLLTACGGSGGGGGATADSNAPVFAGAVLAYSPSTAAITINWPLASDDVSAVSKISYEIYVGTTSDVNLLYVPSNMAATVVNQTSYTATGLTGGTLYYSLVVAVDEAGNKSTTLNTIQATSLTQDLQVAVTPKVVSAMSVTSTPTSANTFTLSGADAGTIAINDVLVIDGGPTQTQTLKKVVSVTTTATGIEVTTADASLNEVISSGTISSSVKVVDLSAVTAASISMRASAVGQPSTMTVSTYADPNGAFTITKESSIGKINLIPKATSTGMSALGAPITLAQEASLTFDYGFQPQFTTKAVFGTTFGFKTSLKSLKLEASGKLFFDALATYKFSGAKTMKVTGKSLGKVSTQLKYVVGTVPVVQDVAVEFFADLKLDVSSSLDISSGLSISKKVSVGLEYTQSGGWKKIDGSGYSNTVTFEIMAQGTVVGELSIYPEISTTFYKAASTSLVVKPGVRLDASARFIPLPVELTRFDVIGYIDSYVTAKLKILSKTLVDWQSSTKRLYSYNAFSLPTVSYLTAPTTSTTGQATQYSISVADGSHNTVPSSNISWSASPSIGITITPSADGKSATVNCSTAGTYDITAQVYGNGILGIAGKQTTKASIICSKPAISIPPAPTGVIASAGEILNSIISWSAATGATSYNLYYGTAPGVTKSSTKIAGVTSPYSHTGLTNDTTYYYIITAVNSAGESSASSEVSVTLSIAAPTGVTGSAGNTLNTLSWSAVSGATSYNLYYGTAPGVTKSSTKIAGVTSPYSHTGLTNGTTYYYIVTAVNSAGESNASSEVPVTPSSAGATAPTGVTASAGNTLNTISWSAVSGAASYNIYWAISTGVTISTGTKITGVTSPYSHTGLTNGTAYYYIVTAVNGVGEGAASTETSATPTVPVRKVPDTGQTTKYSTAFGDDSDYTINPPSYTDNGDGTITDSVTGLMWQKQDDGSNYNWYEASGTADAAYNPGAATNVCGSLTTGGHTDWRLPNEFELMSIGDYETFNPTINSTYFPAVAGWSLYWTATINVSLPFHAWLVDTLGGLAGSSKGSTFLVRCVRGTESRTQSFTDNGDGTITDNVSTLMWQKCSKWQTNDATCSGRAGLISWESAITYCESLSLAGYSDWRLPNIKTLWSIFDNTVSSPAINSTYFPATVSSFYWSATTFASNTSKVWIVDFNGFSASDSNKSSFNYVRCVRQ